MSLDPLTFVPRAGSYTERSLRYGYSKGEEEMEKKKYTAPQLAKVGEFKEATGWYTAEWGLELIFVFPRFI